ncbi:hypothetical protein ChYMVLSRgp1 [Chicory yellow mottle virus large satellite RNA]|uniref:hypothetical protein n=1 Tax=Chicory yellow mottle virus large satellite RNA TaxID=192021 RepID=UPI00000EF282|nr:hypothetical protein ChYMVLSRgp1 [Chicory yellow mottle virus large satellite RNA]BAA00590.1 hypothetical protein [Chicory yellow mottle virus large satellite RNA]BAA00624.1 hypothetical protein [Chicory yellow mottle virus large satellite RNA]
MARTVIIHAVASTRSVTASPTTANGRGRASRKCTKNNAAVESSRPRKLQRTAPIKTGTRDNRSYAQVVMENCHHSHQSKARSSEKFVAAKKVARPSVAVPSKLTTGNKFDVLGFERHAIDRAVATSVPTKSVQEVVSVQKGTQYVVNHTGHSYGCSRKGNYASTSYRCCAKVVEEPVMEKKTVFTDVPDEAAELLRQEFLAKMPQLGHSVTLCPVGVDTLAWGNCSELDSAVAAKPAWFGVPVKQQRKKMSRRDLRNLLSALRLARTTVNKSCSLGDAFMWAWRTLGFGGAAPLPDLKGWELSHREERAAAPLHMYVLVIRCGGVGFSLWTGCFDAPGKFIPAMVFHGFLLPLSYSWQSLEV